MADPDDVRGAGAGLLAGPRGREVCAEVARLVDPRLEVPGHVDDEAGRKRLVEGLTGLDVERVATLEDPLALVDALGVSVDSACCWQEPYERDLVLSDPEVRVLLAPVADALAVAPAARWWWSAAPLDEQVVVRWVEQGRRRARKPLLGGAAGRLRRWREDERAAEERAARERPEDPSAAFTGHWWSIPAFAELVTTSRRLGSLPAVQLELVEDAMGWDRARVAAVDVAAGVRVLEIATAGDWARLVSRHPLDVDRSRRQDWYRATGQRGPWQIPDWAEVGRDHDAVHLSVAGYLADAGRALRTEQGWTVLAGFDPDLTYWITDSLTALGTPRTWRRIELDDLDHVWAWEPPRHPPVER